LLIYCQTTGPSDCTTAQSPTYQSLYPLRFVVPASDTM
jgi:hypothetical protein